MTFRGLGDLLPALAACTIVAKSYLSFARVLAASFHQHHPDIPFFVLLADEPEGCFDPALEPFHVVGFADLDVPRLERFRFHYTQQPLSYASTPYLLSYLLRRGFPRVVFFKQETLVLGNLTELWNRLEDASVVLTPHLVAPLTGPDRIPRELNILLSGTYNGGLLAVADTHAARRFLAWWEDRVYSYCRHAVEDGMHYEQRWLDLAPALFEDVHILRDPAYNVGHWNLPDREISLQGDAVLVNGEPCRVFRFSGFDPDHASAVTKYNNRLTWRSVGPARHVFDRFRDALEHAGFHETKGWPYAYGTFDNGAPIPDLARRLYVELGDAVEPFGDPRLAAPPASFYRWLNECGEPTCGAHGPTRLWLAVYRARPDLQAAFPDIFGADRDGFLHWATQFGAREHNVSTRFPAATA